MSDQSIVVRVVTAFVKTLTFFGATVFFYPASFFGGRRVIAMLLALFVVWIVVDQWLTLRIPHLAVVGLVPPMVVDRLVPPPLVGVEVGGLALLAANIAIVYFIEEVVKVARLQSRYRRWFVAALFALVVALSVVGSDTLITMGNLTSGSSAMTVNSFERLRAGASVNLFIVFLVFAVTRLWHALSPDTITVAGIVCALLTTAWHRNLVPRPSADVDTFTMVLFAIMTIVSVRLWGVITRSDVAA